AAQIAHPPSRAVEEHLDVLRRDLRRGYAHLAVDIAADDEVLAEPRLAGSAGPTENLGDDRALWTRRPLLSRGGGIRAHQEDDSVDCVRELVKVPLAARHCGSLRSEGRPWTMTDVLSTTQRGSVLARTFSGDLLGGCAFGDARP